MAGEEYREFLASWDLCTWVRCRDACLARLERDPSPPELRRAVYLAMYVSWFARVCGDSAELQRGGELVDRLARQALELHGRTPSRDSTGTLGALVAYNGYRVAGKQLLDAAAENTAEAALLVIPVDAAQAVKLLQTAALHERSTPFAPALFFYCDALLRLGNVAGVEQLLEAELVDPASSLVRDLRGRIAEQRARWLEAHRAYSYGPQRWTSHAYRAGLTGVIAGIYSDQDPGALVVDAAVASQLKELETEIDQAELLRRSAFVAACRSSAFEHWAVHFELGLLQFRRRQHASAEASLRLAAQRCPPHARFAVLNARFSNLSWDEATRPEALEVGYAAVLAARDDDRAAATAIRIWLAEAADDEEVLGAAAESKDASILARTHAFRGARAQALACWLSCLESSYQPRAVEPLIRFCIDCELTRCVAWLVDLVLRESDNDFFALWELGMFLLKQRRRQDRAWSELETRIGAIAKRLDALARDDFQHLMRAAEFYELREREDIAATLLLRAAELAEGFEENLRVARARRKLFARQDPHGWRCLTRALRESGERSERLQIARELLAYRQTMECRRLLLEAGVFAGHGDLEPADYVVALECGDAMSEEEAVRLANEAIASLRRAACAGVFARYQDAFRIRLKNAVDWRGLLEEVPPRVDPDAWSWVTEPVATGRERSEAEPAAEFLASGEQIAVLTLGEALDAWATVSHQIDAALDELDREPPARDDGSHRELSTADSADIPLSFSWERTDNWRGHDVADLWRSHFAAKHASDSARSLAAIRAFFDEDARLAELWEAKRRRAAAPRLARVQELRACAVTVLERIQGVCSEQRGWPMLAGLYASLREDAVRHIESLAKRTRSVAGTQP